MSVKPLYIVRYKGYTNIVPISLELEDGEEQLLNVVKLNDLFTIVLLGKDLQLINESEQDAATFSIEPFIDEKSSNGINIPDTGKHTVFTPNQAYKPCFYDWALQAWEHQQSMHWHSNELNFGNDIRNWKLLAPEKQEFFNKLFRFFTQADIDVADGYLKHYIPMFKDTHIKMMLTSFANMETIHIEAYAKIIETLNFPESEFAEFLEYDELKAKHEFTLAKKTNDIQSCIENMWYFGGLSEGVQLFGSFAMLLKQTMDGKLMAMGQIITYSIRDEELHCASIAQLFKTVLREYSEHIDIAALSVSVKENTEAVRTMELAFLDTLFDDKQEVSGLSKTSMIEYIDYLIAVRLQMFGLSEEPAGVHPLPWLEELLSNQEHANFFEIKPTEYAKTEFEGSWEDAWKLAAQFVNNSVK